MRDWDALLRDCENSDFPSVLLAPLHQFSRLRAADPMRERWPSPATARLLIRLTPASTRLVPLLLSSLEWARESAKPSLISSGGPLS